MGIPTAELTPRVQEALSIIVGEFDRTRADLDRERERVAYYQDLADRHSVLPVANRRTLMRDLGRLINRAAHTRTTSTFAILSIRGLERVRETHGRATVDGVLARVAEALSSGLRGSDVLGYLGNGDFAVVLTLTEGRQAEDKAQDLCMRMEAALNRGRAQGDWRVVWGTAPFEAGDDAEAVLDKADSDLRRRDGVPS
jgi:diguanylate cyclase (GGDEF)-like protein